MTKKPENHLTKHCKHAPMRGTAKSWCKYCRLKAFAGFTDEEVREEATRDSMNAKVRRGGSK